MRQSPPTVRAAAVVQAAEAVYVVVASVLSAIDTGVPGRPLQVSSGVALTVIGVGCAAALAVVAVGLARARRWSRTPALLTQLFAGIVGIYVLQSNQLGWGVPLVVLAAAGFATLLAPPSLRALTNDQIGGRGANPPAR